MRVHPEFNANAFAVDAAAKATADGTTHGTEGMTEDEIRDAISPEMWTQLAKITRGPSSEPSLLGLRPSAPSTSTPTGPVRDTLSFRSGIHYLKIVLVFFILFNPWVFLLVLSANGYGLQAPRWPGFRPDV
jgi:hypothetical protein